MVDPSIPIARIQQYTVERCPHCTERHRFALGFGRRAVLTFGGAAASAGLTCPTTGGPIVVELELRENETYLGPVDPSAGAAVTVALPEPAAAGAAVAQDSGGERVEWQKGSRTTALDFCRTMLTTSSGAIPVYTAVLNYVGTKRISGSFSGRLSVLPVIFFLLASVAFIMALVPTLAAVTDERGFREFRDRRLRLLDRYIWIGVTLFVAAMAFSVYFLFSALITV
ncbi:hypothetical protein [Streptomyces violaceus]|uniref:Uncharacterized protein n=1 Tax=Streptomyces violaceus TaxID=1936 RepID=A0ABY9UCV7_STRVL|nr:hypothetical protein [Streptomyces janthinus]WND20239.1 hypothetical protein RI060_24135 [Streptomyces janthinus]GGS64628.1 hypothetical protein GCM10010270_39880 [Streptomyces janthinus]